MDNATASADFQKLIDLLGDDLPDGAGVPVAHIEPAYPDPTNSEFSDITFYDAKAGQSTSTSNHALSMGRRFYGNNQTFSFATGAKDVSIYTTDEWLADLLPNGEPFDLNVGPNGNSGPLAKVQNFSWVASYAASGNPPSGFDLPHSSNERTLAHFDYQIERDDFTAAVGLNNGTGENLPYLLSYSYNAIAVGRSDGNHSPGLTESAGSNSYGPGRVRPDLVVDTGTASAATATVSSAATLLRGVVAGTDADRSEPIKAILMAGATKEASRFTFDWSHTSTQPLDTNYGAGELNIFNSYLIQAGGQFDAGLSEPNAIDAGAHGWDYENIDGGEERFYKFTIDSGITAQELSIVLAWNTPGSTTNISGTAPTLADLNLELRDDAGAMIMDHSGVLSMSNSTVDNVEHIYLQDLAAGDYTLKVIGDTSLSTDYGIAWRTETLADLVNADFDGNGAVDGLDFLAIQRGFGIFVNATHADGDADGDGDVDADDLAALNAGYGGLNSVTQSQFAAFLAPVPEPGTLGLLSLSLLCFAARRRTYHRT
ncbi:PEP-CTERM sorting domain-containing protein [Adhaeretor mobilis]|uniref:PEP-CTERM sorting domain-containing protein n=1 Tax=Adhaeretor mobilis TaxID=1930276 RepID=UPI0011A4F8F7|nr:PEP-CTERM sorting domain-containing protein [Adhaeretor mobilis]